MILSRPPCSLLLVILTAAALLPSALLHAEDPSGEQGRHWKHVVVQPPAARIMAPQSAASLRTPTAMHVAPLRLASESDQPLPPPAPSPRRGLAGGFQPIGALTAKVAVGTSATDADVSDIDRPEDLLDHPELISVARAGPLPVWSSLSPLRSISSHEPLYFEDANLERYGTSKRPRLQPFCSAAHFGISAAVLPYQMALQRPGRQYQYGHPFEAGRYGYRQRTLPPPDRCAAAVQAAVILGLIFALP